MTLELLASHTSFSGEQRLYRHYADTLHRPLELAIYLPLSALGKARPCDVLYYLPGLQTNARLVASQSDYQRYANRYDTILVIPDLFNVYQGDDIARANQFAHEHAALAACLQDELPAALAAHFALKPGRGIMGYGFGGTLAIYHARTHPGSYHSASALAPWLPNFGIGVTRSYRLPYLLPQAFVVAFGAGVGQVKHVAPAGVVDLYAHAADDRAAATAVD